MRVNEKKTTYSTNDGREFTKMAAAKKHEAIMEARARYDNARYELSALLAKSCITADGCVFEIGGWGDYYWITKGCFSPPNIVQVNLQSSNWEIKEVDNEGDTVILIDFEDDCGRRVKYAREYPINELYKDKSKAEAALKIAIRRWHELLAILHSSDVAFQFSIADMARAMNRVRFSTKQSPPAIR